MRISDWSSDVCSSDLIVEAKQGKPHWGARKIRELLVRRLNGDVRIPAKSTVHAVLDRHGLVKRAKERRRHKAKGTPLSPGQAPNDLWCVDFKGEFKLGNGRYCYPLTVTDHAEIGRAHVCTPVTNAHIVCRLLLEKKNQQQ